MTEKSSNIPINQISHTLVTNPIYDGPVYESVLTHFEALTANTQQTNYEKSKTATELSDHNIPSMQSTPGTTHSAPVRYVDHPIQMSKIHLENDCNDGSISPIPAAENEQTTHLASIVPDNRSTEVTINSTAEETYTLMNPAGALTLSAGWKEQEQN